MCKIKKQIKTKKDFGAINIISFALICLFFSQSAQADEVQNYYLFQTDIKTNDTVKPDSFLPIIKTQGFMNKTHNKQRGGFDAYAKGAEAVISTYLSEHVSTGIGYTYSTADVKQPSQKTRIDGDSYFIFGKYQPEKWYVSGKATYNRSQYKDKTGEAENTHAHIYRGEIFSGYEMGNVHNYSGIKYTYSKAASHHLDTVSSAPKENGEVITAVIGTQYGKTIHMSDVSSVKPLLWLSGNYDLKSNNSQTVVDVPESSAVYVLNKHRLHRASIEGGVGVQTLYKGIELSAGYGANWRVSQFSQTGKIRLGIRF